MRFSTLALLATISLAAFVKASPLPAPELDPIAADKAARNRAILLLIKDINSKKRKDLRLLLKALVPHNGVLINTNDPYSISSEDLAAIDTDRLIQILIGLY
ncbi:hypothetical protein GGI12_001227 [Dipsacomyces acuminosporus]|nr:hypothetical protein GGI12_001227 [Dipsacomyces acuminosporus]